jgi:para-aminobenzoate synthetase / 4-amino-4-deoxychorismate lyase
MQTTPRPMAVLDFGQPLHPAAARLRHAWGAPLQVLQTEDAHALPALLQQVEHAARQGCWCVGGLRYEAARALNPQLTTLPATGPLAWFAVLAAPDRGLQKQALAAQVLPALSWENSMHRVAFDGGIADIHAGIAAGHYYQINYTQQLHGQAEAPVDGLALFAALQQAQPGGYALYLDMGGEQIASVSPELFFDWHQPAQGLGQLLTRPMKGTAARGATPVLDAAQANHLQTSAKERAENVMIVDLLRNDVGRIAVTGSVHVPSLFDVQALPSVWQMTSDVRAQLPQGTGLLDVFKALFPCGSVTGAPKRAAMVAIAELESAPRGWYCGALGVVRPDGAGGIRSTFNVPIRSVLVQGAQRKILRCGIGSGITADATPDGEWAEWRSKQAFLERASMVFDVITTMALDGGVFRHLPLHVQRLQEAAAHFAYPFDAQALELTLQHVRDSHPSGLWRVRIALSREGLWSSQVVVCPPAPPIAYLQLASEPLLEAHSEFVRFKTSHRKHYERLAPKETHVFDTLLWNEAGEITEGTRGNVAALMDGQWVTPALSCGLLNGVGRQTAIAEGRVVEGVVRVSDVPRAAHKKDPLLRVFFIVGSKRAAHYSLPLK